MTILRFMSKRHRQGWVETLFCLCERAQKRKTHCPTRMRQNKASSRRWLGPHVRSHTTGQAALRCSLFCSHPVHLLNLRLVLLTYL